MTRVAVTLALALLVGCVSFEEAARESDAANAADLLRTAGFQTIPGDTRPRIEALRAMPPQAFSRVVRNGQLYYVYPDPDECGCLYVGEPAQYAHFERLAAEQEEGLEELAVEDFAMDWALWDPVWGSIDFPMDPGDP